MAEWDKPVSILLYRDRSDWKDVKPIYNSEQEDAVIKIAASEEFIDAFAYLRALLNANEMSERALELTKACAFLNAANYSVWQYRRNIIKALGKDVKEELRYCEEVTVENPKNYQVWHHRKVLIEMCNDASQELDFTANLLQEDSKNYHAWQYRQWVVEKFNLFSEAEIDFSNECLMQDMRNNSAWNYRYFIVSNLSDGFKDLTYLNKDIAFTLYAIKKIPNNESSWSYLAGILINDGLTTREDVMSFCTSLLSQSPPCKSVHLRNFVVDCLVEMLEKKENVEKNVSRIHEILAELEQLDPVRKKYWTYKKTFVDNLVAYI